MTAVNKSRGLNSKQGDKFFKEQLAKADRSDDLVERGIAVEYKDERNNKRWKGWRFSNRSEEVQEILENTDLSPISTKELEVSKCHRRTCRKRYTPSFSGQIFCDSCISDIVKEKKKKKVEERLRCLNAERAEAISAKPDTVVSVKRKEAVRP